MCGRTEKKAFYRFLDNLNNLEPPIRFKATLNKQKNYFLVTTIFKDPENENGLLTKTDRHASTLGKGFLSPKTYFSKNPEVSNLTFF